MPRVGWPNLFLLLAVILFAVGGVLWLTADAAHPVDADTTWELLFFGLASLSIGVGSTYYVSSR